MANDLRLRAIISGGHSGVQRAALDIAIDLAIPHGGVCPEGRIADDGALAPRYKLTPGKDRNHYRLAVRNIKASDGTLVLCNPSTRRTRWSEQHEDADMMAQYVAGACRKLGKPWIVASPDALATPLVTSWLRDHEITVLHIHGPREAGVQRSAKNRVFQPGIGDVTREALRGWLTPLVDVVRANALAHTSTLKAESDQASADAVPALDGTSQATRPEPHGPPLAPQQR